jgi:flagellar protein FliS
MFTSVSARSASVYKKASVDASVEMANPHQLVTMLFEALQRALGAASSSMAAGDVSAKCNHVSTAIRILEEGFIAPLDLANGGELAMNLKNLYEYCVRRLALANAKNDLSVLEEVKQLIAPIASGWKQIDGQGPAYLKPV